MAFISNITSDVKVYHASIAAGGEVQKLGNSDANPSLSLSEIFPGAFNIKTFQKHGPFQMNFFVASDNRNVVVAIRGTQSGNSWHDKMNGETDWEKGVPSPIEKGLSGVMVHPGWAQGTESIIGAVKSELTKHRAGDKTILVCGHSMGGAVAGYLTYRLMNETTFFQRGRDHRLITFGAPRYAATDLFGLLNFKTSFDRKANACGLTTISAEIIGDDVPYRWSKELPHVITVLPMGQPLSMRTSARDKHGATEYSATVKRLRGIKERLRLVRLFCHKTSEISNDEIFIMVSDGTRYPQNGGEFDVDDGDNKLINPNGPALLFTDDTMQVTVWEDDTSGDDKIGHLSIPRSLRGKGLQTAKMHGDGSNYTLYYQVE